MKEESKLLTTLSNNKAAPKWSMGSGRRTSGSVNSIARPGTPGPGAYGAASAASAAARLSPSYGFGTSRRDQLNSNGLPGPGQYQPQDRPRSAGPVYKFGSSARGKHTNCGTPGPGSYAPNVAVTRNEPPKYYITPRREKALTREYGAAPGPGAYSSPERPQSAKSPEWGFGTSERARRQHHGGPGPGAYQTRTGLGTGPQYSIRAKTERYPGSTGGYPQDSPGPGRYGGPYTQFSAR